MHALERFIVDNNDLLQLEELVGRFNIFDALGITHAEIRHSNFLGWLLDPAESHGQGPLFLNAILMDLFKQAGTDAPLSPIELDGAELRGVDIRREWHNIDLLIQCDEPRFVIAVENKIDAGEHGDQLSRYRKTIEQYFPGWPTLRVFLTPDGDDPSDKSWCVYSYTDVYRVLSSVRKRHEKAIGKDVLTFLGHYLKLIGSLSMSDPEIEKLCLRIYKNHKRAIDTINENISTPQDELFGVVKQMVLDDSARWVVIRKAKKSIAFVPDQILQILPCVGTSRGNEKAWIACWFMLKPEGIIGTVEVAPTNDEQLWKKVVERLTRISHQM